MSPWRVAQNQMLRQRVVPRLEAAKSLTDEDILREVMNTVGRKGKLGEHVRCVVSVSMLTEGWDANTVTHIFGLRAFGTKLICDHPDLYRPSAAAEPRLRLLQGPEGRRCGAEGDLQGR